MGRNIALVNLQKPQDFKLWTLKKQKGIIQSCTASSVELADSINACGPHVLWIQTELTSMAPKLFGEEQNIPFEDPKFQYREKKVKRLLKSNDFPSPEGFEHPQSSVSPPDLWSEDYQTMAQRYTIASFGKNTLLPQLL